MTTKTCLLLLLTAMLAVLAPATTHAADSESLYNSQTAKKLTPEQMKMFGPQASRFRYDATMLRAMQIAAERARGHSISRCWRYVKQALLASKAIDSYPKTAYAKQAGTELQKSYGFQKIKVKNPYQAPVGSVLVYGGKGAGHVEIRTPTGFVSDFASTRPSRRPLTGVYVKPKERT
jgi:hypothetical protein